MAEGNFPAFVRNNIMSAYFIKNSSNNIDLINISQSDDAIMIRLFGRYNGPTDNLSVIPREGLETNITEYQGGSLLTDTDGTNYTQRWNRSLKFEENQVQVGGTYLFCTNNTKTLLSVLTPTSIPILKSPTGSGFVAIHCVLLSSLR